MDSKITTSNIREKLSVGQIYKNGGRRYFRVETLDEKSIGIQEIRPEGPSGKILTLGKETFLSLHRNKNYEHVMFFGEVDGRWREKTDLSVESMIQANRFMV